MSARLLQFPPRRSAAVWILRDAEGGWLILCGANAWAHGDRHAAMQDAQWLASNLGWPIRVS
jgi:hypothetical protein